MADSDVVVWPESVEDWEAVRELAILMEHAGDMSITADDLDLLGGFDV
jgi:hypothetical protein